MNKNISLIPDWGPQAVFVGVGADTILTIIFMTLIGWELAGGAGGLTGILLSIPLFSWKMSVWAQLLGV